MPKHKFRLKAKKEKRENVIVKEPRFGLRVHKSGRPRPVGKTKGK